MRDAPSQRSEIVMLNLNPSPGLAAFGAKLPPKPRFHPSGVAPKRKRSVKRACREA